LPAKIAFPFAGVKAISIGPVTTATVRELHWEPVAEAQPHDIPALIAATIQVLSAKLPAAHFNSSSAQSSNQGLNHCKQSEKISRTFADNYCPIAHNNPVTRLEGSIDGF
jgi:hypothetical protein